MAVDESLSASVSRYRARRAALERSSGHISTASRKKAACDVDRRVATTLRIWQQRSRAAVLTRNRSALLLVSWRRRRQVAHRFGWWATQVGRRADLRERLAVLLCRRVRSTLVAALRQWQKGVVDSRHAKDNELQRWREWAHVESYQRRRVASGVRHLLHRMRTRYLQASFGTWCMHGKTERHLNRLLTLRLDSQLVGLQRDAFRDWRCMVRWKCCSEWREDPTALEQRAKIRLAAERLRYRLCKCGLSRAFSSWHAITKYTARAAVLLQNAIARWNTGITRHAFAAWRRLLNRRDKDERLVAMQQLAVMRMNFRGMQSLGECLRWWQRHVARRRRSRAVLANCVLRMQHRLLSCALNGWYQSVQSGIELKRTGTHAIARMLDTHMSNVFAQWRDTTKLMRTRRDIGQRAVKRLRSIFLFAALNEWHDVVTQQKIRRAILQRAVHRLTDNFLFACLHTWRHEAKRQKTLYAIGQRVAKRLKNSHLFAALGMWQNKARLMKQHRNIGNKAVARMRHTVIASALFAWRHHTAARKGSAMIAVRAISKMQHAILGAALRGLRDIIQRHKLHRKLCTRALQRLFCAMLSSAFCAWQESAAEKRRKWSVIQRAVQRLTHRVTSSAFNEWLSAMYRQRKLRHSARVIVMKLTHKNLANALSAWLRTIENHRCMRATRARTIIRLQHRSVVRAFECWWITTVKTRKHRSLCRMVCKRIKRRYTVMAFEHWAESVAAKAAMAAETARRAAEQARATTTVDAKVLDSVVKEYDAAKIEWERRWEGIVGELTESKNTVRTLRQQLEQTRARSTVAVKQASMRRAEEVAVEQQKYERDLEAERQKNSQLADTIVALRAEMERMTSESATHVYIQSVCEDTLVQLMDGNERLRREKLALESTLLPAQLPVKQQQETQLQQREQQS